MLQTDGKDCIVTLHVSCSQRGFYVSVKTSVWIRCHSRSTLERLQVWVLYRFEAAALMP